MWRNLKRLFTALALLTAACSSTPADDLAGFVDAWAEVNDVAAVSVAIRAPGGDLRVLASSRSGDAPSDDALFEVGSLTKTLVAATVLSLVEEEELDLDRPIEAWLPSFPRAHLITLRQLLSHTAGLDDASGEDFELSDFAVMLEPVEPAELVASAAANASSRDLPAPHTYANSGYWVAGAVIEEAVGAPLHEVLRRQVLDPLEMTDTYLAWAETLPRPLQAGELAGPGGAVLPLDDEIQVGVITRAWAAGGVVSTALDMNTFYTALFDGFLRGDSVAAMTSSPAYGLGIERRVWPGGLTGWGHNGAIPGYTASAAVSDDGWTVVALTNRFTVTAAGLDPDTEAFLGQVLLRAQTQE